jgi:hypothetical protein
MAVFFGGGDLPKEVVDRWHPWSRRFEKMWVSVVEANMQAGYLDEGDPVVTTRLIIGMIVWVSRWYRPNDKITSEQIAEEAIRLLRLGPGHAKDEPETPAARPRKSPVGHQRSASNLPSTSR